MLRELSEKFGMSQSYAATVKTGPFFQGEPKRGGCLLIHKECILQAVCHIDVFPSPSSRPQMNLAMTSKNLNSFLYMDGNLNGDKIRNTK